MKCNHCQMTDKVVRRIEIKIGERLLVNNLCQSCFETIQRAFEKLFCGVVKVEVYHDQGASDACAE